MLRPRNILVFLLVGAALLLGWILVESWRLTHATPVVAIDPFASVQTRIVARSGVDPDTGAAAWAALTRAFDVHDAVMEEMADRVRAAGDPPRGVWDTGAADFDYVRSGPTVPGDAERERDAIELFREDGGFSHLAAFARATTAVGPPQPADADALTALTLPELARARHLAKLLAAELRIAQSESDPARVVETFDELLALARATSFRHGYVISLLTGMAIRALALDELCDELVEAEVPEPVCARLLEAIDRRRLASAELAIEGERAFFHAMVQEHFTDDGTGGGYLAASALPEAALARFLGPRRAEVVRIADAFYDEYVTQSRMTASERRARGFDHEAFIAGAGGRASVRFAEVLLPSLDLLLAQAALNRSLAEATRLMLALEIFHARSGRYPETLDALAPSILPAIPADPLHDGPFGYRVNEADDRGFVLYSYGLDATDNGGAVHPNGAWTAYGNDGAGFDAVINVTRPGWRE